jgi:hypothetical protein
MTIQVMRVQDVLNIPSIDSRGNHDGNNIWGGAYQEDPHDPLATVAETIKRKDVDGIYYDNLREAIVKNGINRVPVHVADGSNINQAYGSALPQRWQEEPRVMGNGHHRIRILNELGFPNVLTTTERSESGYAGEYESRATNKLFEPTRNESPMTVIKNHGSFAVEVNNGTGAGWEIVAGPVPRAYGRRLVRNFKDRNDTTKNPNFRARVVPTGTVVAK